MVIVANRVFRVICPNNSGSARFSVEPSVPFDFMNISTTREVHLFRARGESREFLWSRAIWNGAARCSDVFGSGFLSRFCPLLPHLGSCQFLEIDLIPSCGDGLRVLLANLRDWDSTRLYRVLNDGSIEVLELIKVWPLEIMQVENGQLGVGESVEDTLVVWSGISFVVHN